MLPKLALLALLGLVRAGWYPLAQAGLYDEVPEVSGAILVLTNVSGALAAGVPLLFGVIASRAGLSTAMWLLLLGPAIILPLVRREGGRGDALDRALADTVSND